jgi:thiamine biosynthesis lipoprotein
MIGYLQRNSFRAMGTACTLAVTTLPADSRIARGALAAGRVELGACERALSRFDPESDLSRLNRAAGEWVEVDPRLAGALRLAIRARVATDGSFDPTILPALVAAGYDRTFEELEERPSRTVRGWRAGAEIEVAPDLDRARVERGAAVDLGGIGKGFSAERAIDAMRQAWPSLPGALVDLGGDVAVHGVPPERGPWRITVADPRHPGVALGTLRLETGGVATSGRNARRFGPGKSLHHLIDPATGRPAVAGPLAVTVVARDAAWAEVHATALAISELGHGHDHLAAHPGVAALLISHEGEVVSLGPLPLEEAPELAEAVA